MLPRPDLRTKQLGWPLRHPKAAARQEIGLAPGEQGLDKAAELQNQDGVSARHIYFGHANPSSVQQGDEMGQVGWFTDKTLPETKNRKHILSAVASARAAQATHREFMEQ